MDFVAGRCFSEKEGFKLARDVHTITGPLKWACRAFLWMEWHIVDIAQRKGRWPVAFPQGVKRLPWPGPVVMGAQEVVDMEPLLDYLYVDGKPQAPFHAVTKFKTLAKKAAKREVQAPTCEKRSPMVWAITTSPNNTQLVDLGKLRAGVGSCRQKVCNLLKVLCAGTSLYDTVFKNLLDPTSTYVFI
jgi:hypothetical protein